METEREFAGQVPYRKKSKWDGSAAKHGGGRTFSRSCLLRMAWFALPSWRVSKPRVARMTVSAIGRSMPACSRSRTNLRVEKGTRRSGSWCASRGGRPGTGAWMTISVGAGST